MVGRPIYLQPSDGVKLLYADNLAENIDPEAPEKVDGKIVGHDASNGLPGDLA